jgi:quercetin dioxygenase-like cupin family protein
MSDRTKVIQDIRLALVDVPTDSIVSKTIHEDDWMKVILFGFASGQELSEHTASKPAILHFLEGEASVTLGDQSFDVEAGFWAYMPAQLAHSIIAKSPVKMLLLLAA